MADYIKREDMRLAIENDREYGWYTSDGTEAFFKSEVLEMLNAIPSADVTEVKRGEWEVLESFSDPLDDSHKDRCRCANCGFIHVFTDFHYCQYNFCPECGSRMVEHE